MKRVRRNDRGAALIIALAFLALFSLFLAATLSAADGGLHISQSMKVQPRNLYSADGAIEKAIQDIRFSSTLGRDDGVNCNSSVSLNGKTMNIACDPQDGSGLSELGGSSPTLGIIALSNGSLNEAGYQQTGNSIVRIDGGLYSNSTLSFANGNTCNGTDVNCQQLNLCPSNKKTVKDAAYLILDIGDGAQTKVIASNTAEFVGAGGTTQSDVGAPLRGTNIPTGAKISAVFSGQWVSVDKSPTQFGSPREITFREDFPQLQKHCNPPATAHGKLTALLGSCDRTRTVAIQFKCKDTSLPVLPDLEGNDPNYPPDQTNFVTRTVPSCGSDRILEIEPGRYTDVTGLNALASCDKLIWFKPGSYYFDFTGSPNPVWTLGASSNKWQSMVAGAKTWNDRGVLEVNFSNGSTQADGRSSGAFKAGDAGLFINSSYNLPFGTKINSVSADGRYATMSKPANANATKAYTTVGSQDSLCDARTGVNHSGAEFIFGGPSQMVVSESRTEFCAPVDGNRQQIAIYGVKTAAGDLVPQSGCTVAQPYPGVGCATIRTSGPKPMFLVHGTVYMPNAVFDLSLQTVSYQIVSRGIIARVIALGISPSAEFKDPLIYSPNFGSVVGAPRRVLLVACEGGPCGSGGVPKLRALVRYEDTEPDSPNPSIGNRVVIESWTVLR